MKSIILSISILCTLNGISQENNHPFPKDSVAVVNNWNKRSYILAEGFWEKNYNLVIAQIGLAEFEKVKKYSHRNNLPCAMQLFCEDKDGSKIKNGDSLNSKLGKLNLYKIASFPGYNKYGEFTKEFTILRVPYERNKDWDKSIVWDTVYFIVPSQYVEIL
jgi:hypothetical protein